MGFSARILPVNPLIISLSCLNLLFTSLDYEEGLVYPKFLFPPPAMAVMKKSTTLYNQTPLLMELNHLQALRDQCCFHQPDWEPVIWETS